MLQEVFYWVLNMSITAAVTGTLVMLVRLIKKIPRRYVVFLWFIPFLRMTLPVALDSPYSLMSLFTKISTKTVVVYRPMDEISFSMANSVRAADSYFPISYKENALDKLFSIASVIWVIGCAAMVLTLAVIYYISFRELKNSKHLYDNVFLSDKIASPAVYGIIKPKIFLPKSYDNTKTELVLLHEKTHIRYADNLWRAFALTIVAFHWFNPFCWIFLKLLLTDIELACDERVIATLGEHRKKEYALLLLEYKRSANVFVSSFGGAKLHIRIESILSFRRLTWFSAAVFLIFIGFIFCILMTN